jgi:hypothetical protein
MNNIFIRWAVILSVTAILMGGVIWISKHPPSSENGGWILAILFIVGLPVLKIVHLFWLGKHVSQNMKKDRDRNQ